MKLSYLFNSNTFHCAVINQKSLDQELANKGEITSIRTLNAYISVAVGLTMSALKHQPNSVINRLCFQINLKAVLNAHS